MKRRLQVLLFLVLVPLAFVIGGCGNGGGGGSASPVVTIPPTPIRGNFPIGTWIGPDGAVITITKLDHVGIGLHYYSGSISLPRGAGTVNVSGKEAPGDTSLIVLGASLGVGTSIMTSTSATFYNFICDDVSDADVGNPDIRTLDGTMIMTTTSGDNISQRAIFTRQ